MPGLNRTRTERELSPAWQWHSDDYPTGLRVSPDGEFLALGTDKGQVFLLRASSGEVVWQSDAHAGPVLASAFGKDSLATAGDDGRVVLFSLDGSRKGELEASESRTAKWVEHLAYSPKGDMLAASAGKTLRIWRADGTPFLESRAHSSTVTALEWSARSSELATACYGGVYLWKVATGASPRHLPFKGSLISLAWSPNERVVACGSQDCSVHFWRLDSGTQSAMNGYRFKPKSLAWDGASTMLATGGDATVCVWPFEGKGPEGVRPIELSAHKGVVTALAFHPRKALLASVAQDMGLVIWEPRKGQARAFAFLRDTPESLLWHPRVDRVFTSDASGSVSAWDVLG